MPPDRDRADAADSGRGEVSLPPPPSFTRQAAQLVIIPAAIVIVCIGLAVLFGRLAGSRDSIENQLARLEQSSGGGKLALGLQDPRYKDRGLAAYNIATLIPTLDDPTQRLAISQRLARILAESVGPKEVELHVYLLTALGQLGQSDGLAVIEQWLTAPEPLSRLGAIRGLLSWPDIGVASALTPKLLPMLGDEPAVAAEAAAAIGQLAGAGDDAAIEALRRAMNVAGSERREVQWNAAVALARLGDEVGSGFVADTLLDRAALARLPADGAAGAAGQGMSVAAQDRLMLAVLAAAADIADPRVRARVKAIASDDPSPVVRRAAVQLRSALGEE